MKSAFWFVAPLSGLSEIDKKFRLHQKTKSIPYFWSSSPPDGRSRGIFFSKFVL